MDFNFFAITSFLVLGIIAAIGATPRQIYFLVSDLKNRKNDIIKVVSVQQKNGSEIGVALGSADVIDEQWHNITGSFSFGFRDFWNMSSYAALLLDIAINGQSSEKVVFIAEKYQKDPGENRADLLKFISSKDFGATRWFRCYIGYSMKDWTRVQLTIYNRMVFFVRVAKFKEPVTEETLFGVAYFREYEGTIRPGKLAMHANDSVNQFLPRGSDQFDYNAPYGMIALQYNYNFDAQVNFTANWKYYNVYPKREVDEVDEYKVERAFE